MSVSTRVERQPSPLPTELTPLLGRDREADQLQELIDDPSIRLVTITGPGGVGKTRLALHVAASLMADFEEAVAYVPLASIRDSDLVLPEILQQFGVFSNLGDTPEDQLAEILRDQLMLLVLDNMEQVLESAPALARVLARCPRVTLLATSQAALGVAGEQLFPLAPLPMPDADATTVDAILRSDAVALFVQRARAVNPNMTIDDHTAMTIAGICRELDGLPLAIELAAARTTILSPEALLARLSNRLQVLGGGRRDVPDRLRTMRNAIAWSYDLLTPEEQSLFRRMAVFVGGIPLDAVESIFQPICGGGAFDVLGTLVNHSLVQTIPLPDGEARFLMLETLRHFGMEQLTARGDEEEARLAHAEHLARLAGAAEPHLIGHGQEAWLNRLDPETENIRAACNWALDNGHPEIVLRIGGVIWRFCSKHGLASDCRDWLRRALAAESTADSPWRSKSLIGLGNLLEERSDFDSARLCFEEGRDVARRKGDLATESEALVGLGTLAHDTGEYAEALEFHSEAARIARESGNQHCIARAVGNMGTVSYFRGNLDDAERYWEESRSIMAALGDTTTEAVVSSNLAVISFDRGDLERAEELNQRVLNLQRQVNSTRDIPYTLVNLGEVLSLLGDYTQAHDCFAEAITLLREQGNTAIEGQALHGLAALVKVQGDLPGAARLVIESTRLLSEIGDQRSLIGNAELLAGICAAHGHHAGVVTLLAASARNRKELGADPTPLLLKEFTELTDAAQVALSDQEYNQAHETGRQTDLDALPRRISIIAREVVGKQHPFPDLVDSSAGTSSGNIDYNLTARENDVLRLLVDGNSTAEISETLFISPRTTTTHITNILGKLGVPSRTAAVALALREGLV